jgi:DHA1 family multidrug resistance protein-like MFS transporter
MHLPVTRYPQWRGSTVVCISVCPERGWLVAAGSQKTTRQDPRRYLEMSHPGGAKVKPAGTSTPRQSWRRTLYTMWFAQLMSLAGFSFVMPFLPFYIRELGNLSESQVPVWAGFTYSLAPIMLCIFSPIWGTLADRHGRKMMVQRSMFGGGLVMLLMSQVHTLPAFLVLRLLQGALAGTVVASTTLVSSVTPRDRLGYSLGMMQMAVLLGSFAGPWIGGAMADAWGYRMPFMAAGIVVILAGIAVQFLVHENFTPPVEGAEKAHSMRAAFGGKGLLALLSVFFFVQFSASFVMPIFPLFVESLVGHGDAASTVGKLMGITGLAAGISTVIVGRLSDQVGHKRTLVCTTMLTGLISIPHALVTGIGQLFGLRVGMGLATGGTNPSLNAIVGQSVSPEMYGRSYGIVQSASSLGMAAGPLVGGFVTAAFGLRVPFVIMGVLLMLSSAMVAIFVRPRVASEQEQHQTLSPPSPVSAPSSTDDAPEVSVRKPAKDVTVEHPAAGG